MVIKENKIIIFIIEHDIVYPSCQFNRISNSSPGPEDQARVYVWPQPSGPVCWIPDAKWYGLYGDIFYACICLVLGEMNQE